MKTNIRATKNISVRIHFEWSSRPLDGPIIEVSRVPCVGEYIMPDKSGPASLIVRVVHNLDCIAGTAANLTLRKES